MTTACARCPTITAAVTSSAWQASGSGRQLSSDRRGEPRERDLGSSLRGCGSHSQRAGGSQEGWNRVRGREWSEKAATDDEGQVGEGQWGDLRRGFGGERSVRMTYMYPLTYGLEWRHHPPSWGAQAERSAWGRNTMARFTCGGLQGLS